ncbi:MAG: hypothetical protein AAF414_21160 [Pseudomonadota bacterium]
MDNADKDLFAKPHVDYEVNACIEVSDKTVVTVIGSLGFGRDPASPFMPMIAPAK